LFFKKVILILFLKKIIDIFVLLKKYMFALYRMLN